MVSSTMMQDISDVQASTSPSSSRVAILRQDQDKKKKFVEIWINDKLEASQEVSNTHGAFVTEGALDS
jgi:acylaminoacyl-peptidase